MDFLETVNLLFGEWSREILLRNAFESHFGRGEVKDIVEHIFV